MKELGITNGEWIRRDYRTVLCPNDIDIITYKNGKGKKPEVIRICNIVHDAGNTAQKCGLLPSELLQQRDELREALINVMVVIKDCYPLLFDNEKTVVKQAEAAIKNTER